MRFLAIALLSLSLIATVSCGPTPEQRQARIEAAKKNAERKQRIVNERLSKLPSSRYNEVIEIFERVCIGTVSEHDVETFRLARTSEGYTSGFVGEREIEWIHPSGSHRISLYGAKLPKSSESCGISINPNDVAFRKALNEKMRSGPYQICDKGNGGLLGAATVVTRKAFPNTLSFVLAGRNRVDGVISDLSVQFINLNKNENAEKDELFEDCRS